MFLAACDNLGQRVIKAFQYTLSVWSMVYVALRSAFNNHKQQNIKEMFKITLTQVYFTGVQGLPLVGMLALIAGTLTIIQASSQLSKVGGGAMLGNLLVVLIVRELGPLITALVVVARSGTAVASELGTMKVNSEIEALESMGIDPMSFIVFPRLVGGIISIMCLSLYFNVIALGGGYIIAQFVHPLSFEFYVESIIQAVSSADAGLFLIKNLFSGAMIFTIACYQGLLVKQSFTEVPQVTTKAVMNSIVYTVGFNGAVSVIVYLQNLKKLGIL